MICLYCGKEIKDSEQNWHRKCIKEFFGTAEIPEIKIDITTLKQVVNETTRNGFTIPGVQKKISLFLTDNTDVKRLTIHNYPIGYILKPQVEEFVALPEAEHLVMKLAKIAGINTVPNALIEYEKNYAYITRRIDRYFANGNVKSLAMEDFCQLQERLTEDKYNSSYERCAKIIEKYSKTPGLDISELFMRLVFCFIIGNSDMHLKNFALLENKDDEGTYCLSPAYDLLPVNVVMPSDKEEFALRMNGKKKNIKRSDFIQFAGYCKISEKSANKIINNILNLKDIFVEKIDKSKMPLHYKEALKELMMNRIEALN